MLTPREPVRLPKETEAEVFNTLWCLKAIGTERGYTEEETEEKSKGYGLWEGGSERDRKTDRGRNTDNETVSETEKKRWEET